MRIIIQIARYIIENNTWYQIPQCFFRALFYQLSKRVTQRIFSKNLFNGKKIFLFPSNPISSAFIYTNIPDKKEILSLRHFADKETIFFDIGANVGAYSVLLMDKVKNVYAFEAHPETANYCKMNFLLNGLNENQVIVKALSDTVGPKYFSNFTKGAPTNSMVTKKEGALQVEGLSLDSFVKEKNFSKENNYILKIDVEGFEHEVFEGGREFFKNFPIRAIIFESFSPKNAQILRLLEALQFQVKPLSEHNILAFK